MKIKIRLRPTTNKIDYHLLSPWVNNVLGLLSSLISTMIVLYSDLLKQLNFFFSA